MRIGSDAKTSRDKGKFWSRRGYVSNCMCLSFTSETYQATAFKGGDYEQQPHSDGSPGTAARVHIDQPSLVFIPMTDEPPTNRITEQEEFHRNVYGHLDAIRRELLEQDERLDHLQALVTNLVNAHPTFDWRNNLSCVIVGLVIGLLIGRFM